jgi:hypothetical protein
MVNLIKKCEIDEEDDGFDEKRDIEEIYDGSDEVCGGEGSYYNTVKSISILHDKRSSSGNVLL